MPILISAVAAIIFGLSLFAGPGKLIKNIQAQTNSTANVSANTTVNGSGDIIGNTTGNTTINSTTDSQNETSHHISLENVESNEVPETNVTGNISVDVENHKSDQEEKGENKGKAEGHEKDSAYNNRSGKQMPSFIPSVAIKHSVSLDVSGKDGSE